MPTEVETELHKLVGRHRQTGVLVDTNMLIVYLVSLLDEKWASAFGYSSDDVLLLKEVLAPFKKLIVTPAILGEVTNLSNVRLPKHIRNAFFQLLSELLPKEVFSERNVALSKVVSGQGFGRLGFADGTIEELARTGIPVITDDFDLYFLLASNELEVFNYNHIRYIADEDYGL